jgi:hypothetical protein
MKKIALLILKYSKSSLIKKFQFKKSQTLLLFLKNILSLLHLFSKKKNQLHFDSYKKGL